MQYKIRVTLLVEIALCLILGLLAISFESSTSTLTLCRYALVVSIVLALFLRVQMKSWLNPVVILYAAFCLFQLGQYYLYAIGIDYDYYFLHSYYSTFTGGEEIIKQSIRYSIVCICTFTLGISIHQNKSGIKDNDLTAPVYAGNNSEDEALKRFGGIIFWISVPFAIVYAGLMLYIAISYGYHGIRNGAGAILLARFVIFNRMSQFFVPSVLLLRICYRNTDREKIYNFLIIIYAAIYIVVGQRTICMALILTYLFLKKISSSNYNRRASVRLIIGLVVLMILSTYIAETRSAASRAFEFSSIISPVFDFIGECGWTGFILPVIIAACPTSVPFAYGKAYFASLTGFLPSFIDPTGTLTALSNYCSDMWVTNYLGFSWGVGYSLIGESYFNFSWFGAIAIFFIGLIIAHYINGFNLDRFNEQPLFRQYVMIVLLYEVITLPRRGIFNFFNILFYDVFIFYVAMKLLKKKNRS